jgi:hypothetical protein
LVGGRFGARLAFECSGSTALARQLAIEAFVLTLCAGHRRQIAVEVGGKIDRRQLAAQPYRDQRSATARRGGRTQGTATAGKLDL